jgi:membrane protein implicated in regulation of membrane protease activity
MNAKPLRPVRQSLGAIFFLPGIIAAVSCAGLVSALIGDGVWDGLSWLTLSAPIAIVLWFAFRRRKSPGR